MGRKPRILFPGAFYHVYNRGNDKHPIFRDDDDRAKYLSYVARYARELSVVINAYCLLGNHFHLFLQTLLANLPQFMQRLNLAYAKWYNNKRDKTGHLFTSRYNSVLVQEGSQALELTRYIHLNPVKAELVSRPEDWRWSSYREYTGKRVSTFLSTEMTLGQFGRDLKTQYRAYQRFVLEGLKTGTAWEEPPVREGLFLGDDEFIEEIVAKYGSPDGLFALEPDYAARGISVQEITDAVLRESGLTFETLRESRRHRDSRWRNLLIYLCREITEATLQELSEFLVLSPGEISRAKYRFAEGLRRDKQLVRTLGEVLEGLPAAPSGGTPKIRTRHREM
jgi:putative transposase